MIHESKDLRRDQIVFPSSMLQVFQLALEPTMEILESRNPFSAWWTELTMLRMCSMRLVLPEVIPTQDKYPCGWGEPTEKQRQRRLYQFVLLELYLRLGCACSLLSMDVFFKYEDNHKKELIQSFRVVTQWLIDPLALSLEEVTAANLALHDISKRCSGEISFHASLPQRETAAGLSDIFSIGHVLNGVGETRFNMAMTSAGWVIKKQQRISSHESKIRVLRHIGEQIVPWLQGGEDPIPKFHQALLNHMSDC